MSGAGVVPPRVLALLLTDDPPLMEYFRSLPEGEPLADVEAVKALERP